MNIQNRFLARRLSNALRMALVACALLTSGSALAVDGVIEINQASAVAGVALGDAPGFPVTLALRGSYRLTGELNVPANTTGIVFQNDHIHLDLNGFAIVGGGGTSGYGVQSAADTKSTQSVSNGAVRGMPSGGIRLGHESRVENVTVATSGGVGIRVGENGLVDRCTVVDSGSHGVEALGGSRVFGTTSTGNGSDGIRLSNGVVDRSVANQNGSDGIWTNGTTPVTNSSAYANGQYGILAVIGPVIGNAAAFNGSNGLNLADTVPIAHNIATGNQSPAGDVQGGTQVGGNVCGLAACP